MQRAKSNPGNRAIAHALEIQVSRNEVHHDAGCTSCRIAMLQKQLVQRANIVPCFERAVVVRILSEWHAGSSELLKTAAVTHPDAAPIIALDDEQGTVEPERWSLLSALQPEF